MRLAFMGTPDFAVRALDALVEAGHSVVAVYTQPPRPANRGGRLTPTPVHKRAEGLALPVRTPDSFKAEAEKEAFRALDLDVAVVAAYGLILPQAILDAPRHGAINIHASLLPRWRGAAPVQRAILAGDRVTGVTIMQMERGLDTGPMLLHEELPIGSATADQLTEDLASLGARMIVDALARLSSLTATPQAEGDVTYAHKIDKAEARIDWSADAEHLERLVRAMHPAPGAWFEAGGERVKLRMAEAGPGNGAPGEILPDGRVACGQGALRLLRVQPAGKAAMDAENWWRGRRFQTGDRLG